MWQNMGAVSSFHFCKTSLGLVAPFIPCISFYPLYPDMSKFVQFHPNSNNPDPDLSCFVLCFQWKSAMKTTLEAVQKAHEEKLPLNFKLHSCFSGVKMVKAICRSVKRLGYAIHMLSIVQLTSDGVTSKLPWRVWLVWVVWVPYSIRFSPTFSN